MKSISPSELQVLELKAQGYCLKEIASKRFVSINTVKTQFKRLIEKLDARSGYHAVAKYAASNPELFKKLVAIVFLSIQGYAVINSNNSDWRKARRRVRTHKVSQRLKY